MHSAISAQLQLKEVKKLNDNTVMVHYEVVT
jgi:hypothetical protein